MGRSGNHGGTMTGFSEAQEIKIKLPASAIEMRDVVNHVGKCLSKALIKDYPEKIYGRRRWLTTGMIDFRPGGSVSYFVSYEEKIGFTHGN